MTIITAKIPDKLDKILSSFARETDKSKDYVIRKAIENYIEEETDIRLALAIIERGEDTIPLSAIKKEYGLGN